MKKQEQRLHDAAPQAPAGAEQLRLTQKLQFKIEYVEPLSDTAASHSDTFSWHWLLIKKVHFKGLMLQFKIH